MTSVGTIVTFVLAVVLLLTAVLLVRSRSRLPWPAIGVCALASAVCFTVGGGSAQGTDGPGIATVMGSVVGFLGVASAIIALVPRRSPAQDGPAPRVPIVLSAVGIVLGAIGLLVTLLTE
jgi:drug/metabolite transporter (DMT)-like permease